MERREKGISGETIDSSGESNKSPVRWVTFAENDFLPNSNAS